MVRAAVGKKCARKCLGDVHELVNEGLYFLAVRQFVEAAGIDLDDVMGLESGDLFEEAAHAPYSGYSARLGVQAAYTVDAAAFDVREVKRFHQMVNLFFDFWSQKVSHKIKTKNEK